MQMLFPFAINQVHAETPINNTHIVALIVDKDLMDNSAIEDEIQRYASSYIQQAMWATKALILPIDTEKVSAPDVLRMLENLYFEGQKDVTSSLDGVVLIWEEVPLPVINDDGYIFPTIFPYVDFLDQRFLFSKESGYFEPNDKEVSEPEIWHGAIFLGDEDQSYLDYFAKLRSYQANPEWYIGKKIWYDDFRAYAETLNPDFIGYYINKFIFAEDINYKRFHGLLFDLFNADHNANVDALFNTPIQFESGPFYADSAQDFNDIMGSQPPNPDPPANIPTKIIESTLTNFFKSYSQLLGNKYLRTMRDNVQAPARWLVGDIDTHSDFIEIQDSLYLSSKTENSILMQYNETLKKALIAEVDEKDYAMHIPLLTYYKEEKNQVTNWDNLSCWKPRYYLEGEYENFYFWRNAYDIDTVDDTNFFRGTYQNFSSIDDVQAFDYTLSGVQEELMTKSIWGSYWVLSQQVEANRWYNVFLSQADIDDQQDREDRKWDTACEDVDWYIDYYRWGNTPLNLEAGADGGLQLEHSDYNKVWNPSFNRNIGGWLYDIVWAKRVSSGELPAHDRQSLYNYAIPQRITRQEAVTVSSTPLILFPIPLLPMLPPAAVKDCDVLRRRPLPYQPLDYFEIMDSFTEVEWYKKKVSIITWSKIAQVPIVFLLPPVQAPTVLAEANADVRCGLEPHQTPEGTWFYVGWEYKAKQEYEYKTIDSTLVHDSPSVWEFNNMNQFTTLDSPIDSITYMNFQWLHGETITLNFPNLYHVPVYTNNSGTLDLMDTTGIMDSIDAYLRNTVIKYNQDLLDALTQRNINYNAHRTWYDLLGSANHLATPNRGYQLMDEELFVNLMPQELKKQFAEILHFQNTPWKTRTAHTNAIDDIAEIKNTADINAKVKSVISKYLVDNDNPGEISMRGYNPDWYEVAFINSDWNDYLSYDAIPVIVDRILNQQNDLSLLADNARDQDLGPDQLECGIDSDGTVPLFGADDWYNWFQSLACWLEITIASPAKLEITFKDAQGPVLVLDGLKNIINDYSKPVLSWEHEDLETYPSQWVQQLEDQIANDEAISSLTWEWAPNMQDVLTHIQPSTSSEVFFLEPVAGQTQTPYVRIKATKNLGEITRRISALGDNCVEIQGQDICDTPYEVLLNPYTEEQLINVNLTDTKAGTMVIRHELCIEDSCVAKSDRVFVAPGNPANINIDFPYDQVLAWAEMPILVTAEDQFGNLVGEQIERYKLTVTDGKINGREQPQEFTNFGRATFLYESHQDDPAANISINVEAVNDPSLPTASATFDRVKGTLSVTSGSLAITWLNYKLPDTYNAIRFVTFGGLQDLNTGALPVIDLELNDTDWNPLNVVAGLQVKNWLIEPGHFEDNFADVLVAWEQTTIKHRLFKQDNTIIIEDGKASVVIFPQMKAWEDELIITIPGIDPFVLPITIEAWSPRLVQAKTTLDELYIGQTADVDLTVTDLWKNIIPGTTELDVRAIGAISYTWALTIDAIDGKASIEIEGQDPGGRWFVTALINGTSFTQQSPGFAAFNVQNSFIPTDNLNVMYMNLFGSDRANLWWYFSQNDSIATEMINNSPKILALTTQLVDPTKIFQFVATIKSNGHISSEDPQNIRMELEWQQLYAEHKSGDYSLSLWEFSDYSWEQRQTRDWIPDTIWSPTIFYVPFIPDTSFTQNVVQGNTVILNWNTIISSQDINVEIILTEEKFNKSNIWEVKYLWIKVWEIVLIRNDQDLINDIEDTKVSQDFDVTIHFGNWSTNGIQSLWIYSLSNSAEAKWYESIETSIDYTSNVGFRHLFQNITAFWDWSTVGEATRWFASPLLINLWDPLLKRIDRNTPKNDTDFDAGIGQVINTDAKSPILKVVEWDINNDDLVDFITIYTDWRVQRSKNYGWDNPMTDLWDLLRIDERIKDVWLGDVDGNNYKDILVRTNKDKLRVYKNTNTVFWVDWYPVCLDHGGDPDSLASVEQFFLEDMDLDGALDIVMNTHLWEIKIVYGWTTASGDTYVSNNLLGCDESRRLRQQDNIKVVKQYGSEIREELKVVDNSLIRREGLSATDEFDQIENPDIASSLPMPGSSAEQGIDFSTFDPASIVNDAAWWILRWSIAPVPFLPLYETLDEEEIRYVAINQGDSADEVKVFKTYKDLNWDLLQSGDVVNITVTIEWPTTKKLTYFELLKGPRTVSSSSTLWVSTLNTWTLNDDAVISPLPDSEYLLVIDNIDMDWNDDVTFSYTVTYSGWPLVRIDVDQVSEDEYPDIKVFPIDWCMQYRRDCINTNESAEVFREYEEVERDLWATLDEFINNQQQSSQNHMWDTTNTIQNIVGDQSIDWLSDVTWIWGQRDFSSAFDDFVQNDWEVNFWNIELNFFEEELEAINWVLDEALKWLCGGFSIENAACQWLPVPFNMSFLTPWEFNIFGCKPKFPTINRIFPDDKWFPAFWFPGTQQTSVGPIPFPWWTQMLSNVDDFGYGFPSEWGNYPSAVRIYVSPTLTMGLGLAVCLGPQAWFNNIPSPFQDVAGNCVVLALPSPTVCGSEDGGSIDWDLFDALDKNSCATPPITPSAPWDTSSSPRSLVAKDPIDGQTRPPVADGTYFGMLQFESSPNFVEEDTTGGVPLNAAEQIGAQVQWGMQAVKWLVKCIINDWLDKQVRYMLNNLTNLTIWLYLPDLTDLAQWFDQLNTSNFKNKKDALEESQNNTDRNADYKSDWVLGNAGANIMRSAWLQKWDLRNLSDWASNPFDAISEMFNNIPLVNINTRDINITIPAIYSEDIRAYTTYLNSYLQEQRGVLQEWEGLIQSVIWVCGQELTPDQIKNGISKAKSQGLTWGKLKDQIQKLKWTVIDKTTNMKKEAARLNGCKSNPTSCQWETAESINAWLENLNAYAWVDNECMSFMFGPKIDGEFQTDKVNTNLSNFLDFQVNTEWVMNSIRQNLRVLERYRQFPFELYERVHVWDRYLSELSATLDSFLGSLTFWLQQNSRRFEKYVDVIITLIWIIKTYQALIDISVNRSSQCSKCTNDNYDNYACKLSVICVDLPLLPIPPFKIPSIFLDFSHLDLGIDLLLPEFNFVPTTIPLPDLPNLPSPPQVNLDFNLDIQSPEFEAEIQIFVDLLLGLNRGLNLGNLSIPNIPILPEPPILPPLPSFLPTLELELPVLPPAPRIPQLSPEIKTVLDITDAVGQIYCIIKWGIWLVGEQGVKSKIEQLTQRSWDVPLFDDMNITSFSKETPLQGFDWKVDAYLAFNYNFTYIYDLLKWFADIANENVNKYVVSPTNEGLEQFNNLSNKLESEFDVVEQPIDLNINIPIPLGGTWTGQTWAFNWNSITDNIAEHTPGSLLHTGEEDYTVVFKELTTNLRALKESKFASQASFKTKKLMTDTIDVLHTDSNVTANVDGIDSIREGVDWVIDERQKYMITIADQIKNDYDGFLDSIGNDVQFVSDSVLDLRYEANLFNIDQKVKKAIEEQEHPMRTYLELQATQMDGYEKALKTNSPASLNLSSDKHDKIHGQVRYLKSGIELMLEVLDDEVENMDKLQSRLYEAEKETAYKTPVLKQKTTDYAIHSLVCEDKTIQNEGVGKGIHPSVNEWQSIEWPNLDDQLSFVPAYQNAFKSDIPKYTQAWNPTPSTSQENVMKHIDFKQYLEGIYIRVWDAINWYRHVKVVNSAHHGKQIDKNYTMVDLNQSWKDDILMRDTNSIYIKYADQDDIVWDDQAVLYITDLYETNPIQSLDDLKTRTQNSDWFMTINGEEFKLYTPHYEVKNFDVAAQDFESITYRWTNSNMQNENVDAYLIKINLRADLNHTKQQTKVFLDPDQQLVQYLLMLPDGVETGDAKILVSWELWLAPIEQYMTWDIVKVGRYLPENDILSYAMTEMPRRRYYSEIITLSNIWTDEAPVYFKQSPRSNQVLGGQQIIADEEPPIPEISLYRVETDEVVDEGNALNGYISTTYDLVIEWEDNVEVAANMLIQSWEILAVNSGATTVLSWLYFEQIISEEYTIAAVDVNDNDASDEFTLDISIPNLAIIDVQDVPGWKDIITELDQDLDDGNIRFERNRFGFWEGIEWLTWGNLEELFPIGVGQFITTWWVFQEWEKVEFNDSNWELVALLDPVTGEITIDPAYQSFANIQVDFDQWIPLIQLVTTNSDITLFSTYLAPKNLADINPVQLNNWSYDLISLDEEFFWDFAGGTCVQNTAWVCEVYISPKWVIYVPEPFNTSYSAEYRYNANTETITYSLQSIEGNNVVDVTFQIEPLTNE